LTTVAVAVGVVGSADLASDGASKSPMRLAMSVVERSPPVRVFI